MLSRNYLHIFNNLNAVFHTLAQYCTPLQCSNYHYSLLTCVHWRQRLCFIVAATNVAVWIFLWKFSKFCEQLVSGSLSIMTTVSCPFSPCWDHVGAVTSNNLCPRSWHHPIKTGNFSPKCKVSTCMSGQKCCYQLTRCCVRQVSSCCSWQYHDVLCTVCQFTSQHWLVWDSVDFTYCCNVLQCKSQFAEQHTWKGHFKSNFR